MKVITIGRSSECSVVINDVKVSRVHAQLVQDDNGNVSVVDLGSTNGTRVNGKRITGEMRLNPGDELRVGDTMLPWQSYIATMPSQAFQPIASNTQSPATVVGEDATGMPAGKQRKNKNTLLWIILAGVLGLLITGGVVWLLLGRGAASSGTNDTIRIVDTVRNKEYEKYLQSIIDEKDAIINSRPQPTPGKKQPTDSIGANAKQGIKDSTDAKPGVSTNSPNTRPVPTMQTPQQQKNELQKMLYGINDDQKLGNIYNDCYDIYMGGGNKNVKKITKSTERTRSILRKEILNLFDAANNDTKTNILKYVKNNS